MRGLVGPAVCCNKTIFGMLGRIFGGAAGAAVLIKVWRGCEATAGSVKTRWRGWKASAPSLARGFAAFPRGLGFGAGNGVGVEIFSGGRSLIGPDQVSWKFSSAGFLRGAAGSCGQGMTRNTTCQSAAAITAARGVRASIQQS